jgi:hypothetical protein
MTDTMEHRDTTKHPETLDEFYVGYMPVMASGIARRVATAVVAVASIAAIVASIALFGQRPLPASRFEFGIVRSVSGVLTRAPYPAIVSDRGRMWLVAPGKFGAEQLLSGVSDGGVTLDGSLIERGRHRMLEILPGTVHVTSDTVSAKAASSAEVSRQNPHTLGVPDSVSPATSVILRGEIVDSKCFLGVMNPGQEPFIATARRYACGAASRLCSTSGSMMVVRC